MVEKVDRPEVPRPYEITRPKDAKEDQHREPDQREEQERKYQRQLSEKNWSKFGERAATIKPVKVDRTKISRCLFRGASLHNGIGLMQMDVIWVDGKITAGALFLLKNLEDLIRLRKYKPGEEIPESFWVRGPTVELGIIQQTAANVRFTPAEKTEPGVQVAAQKRKWGFFSAVGIINDRDKKINWGIVALYLFLISIAMTALIIELRIP